MRTSLVYISNEQQWAGTADNLHKEATNWFKHCTAHAQVRSVMRVVRDCQWPMLRHEPIGAEQLEYPEVKSICRWQPLTNRERCSLNLPRNVVPNQMLEPVALLDEHFQLVSLVHSILFSCFKNVLGLLIHLITTHIDKHTSINLEFSCPSS